MKGPNASAPLIYLFSLVAAMLAWTPYAQAKTIYQYVDQQGAMAYSDEPPAFTNDFIVIELPDPPPADSGETENTIDEMVETTERLEAAREAREEERRRERRDEAPPVAHYPAPEYDDDGGYFYPGYYPYPRFPRNRRADPPYRIDRADNPAEQRFQDLRTPIRIPQFGTGEPLHQRLEPFDPPARPPQRR